jgi:F420-non-reducing hydrogenase iron-sulfur subunit
MKPFKETTEMSSPRIVGFCCKNALNSLGGQWDMSGNRRLSLEPAIRIVQLPCSSKVETLGIIKAFESGADAIFVLGCPPKKCHLLDGNDRALKVVKHTKGLLDEIGIGSFRLDMFQLVTPEAQHFDRIINTMTERIQALSHV